MPTPLFLGAGAGVEVAAGTSQTVSKTGCIAGNFLMLANFDSDDTGGGSWTAGTVVNMESLAGVSGSNTTWINTTNRQVLLGRVIANGTVSRDITVVAGTASTLARIYELSGVNKGSTLNDVRESSAEVGPLTDATVQDRAVTTLGPDRLAINLVNVRSPNVLGDFVGETGGSWVEAAQYNGSTMTQLLAIAMMPSAGTIDGGTITQAVAYWINSAMALIPGPSAGDNPPIGFSGRGAGW